MRSPMSLVRFVRLGQNGFMQCVAQTLTRLGVRPNHDVRSFVAGFRKLCPHCCYVDVVISADITVSVMELGYKDHRVILFRSRGAATQLRQRAFVLNSSGESILALVYNNGLNYSAPFPLSELAF